MQAYYTIYDIAKNRVGVVESSNTFESLNNQSLAATAVEKTTPPAAPANKTAQAEVKKAASPTPAPAPKKEETTTVARASISKQVLADSEDLDSKE